MFPAASVCLLASLTHTDGEDDVLHLQSEERSLLLVSNPQIVLTANFEIRCTFSVILLLAGSAGCVSSVSKQSKSAGMRNGVTALFSHCVSKRETDFQLEVKNSDLNPNTSGR